jgi:hypothetical protein
VLAIEDNSPAMYFDFRDGEETYQRDNSQYTAIYRYQRKTDYCKGGP